MCDIGDQDDLFRYTSGRWLINEKYQLEQRFVKFNVNNLCSQAASLFGPKARCIRIAKMGGNFNKAFLLTMNDGNEVIAKIPCPNSGTPVLTTTSEVATLKFLRSRISIRVPEVYAWKSDPTNPVGAEYIIMEKIRGVPLAERWETMNTLERYQIIDRIVEMEKELLSLKFPAYGSLFLQDSLPSEYRRCPLPTDLDPTGLFYIGPSCSRAHKASFDISNSNIGPWTSILDFALSIPHRELALVANNREKVQHHLTHFSEDQSADEYCDLLQKVLLVLPALSRHPQVLARAGSTIWHTDLHLGNIYVSTDDPTTIEGVIDWQSAQAAPLFIQAQFPEFLRPPKDYSPGTEIPALPDNFDELDPDERVRATKEQTLAAQSKYYEMFCLAYNKPVYDAMELDRRLWEPFTCCQLFSHGSLVPLRNALIRLSQDWDLLGLPGRCPFEFTEEDIKRHNGQVQQYECAINTRE
ncbi:phosphotransferase family protein [Aspergillus ibericus CBS 121593]|uniref:Altered inheritance of mitochondria protein 9, mitochondrial n=1 Tax=Aspergillus ibericus CBS 121593 TaxID=1448316 RepID=A0A395H2U0_9EURO|nr:phosphotransferase family protein [Aspergillus ibericus CBS 121593]RAL01940.1 phosphotransferase family protein [Aspergillus ibericus CBS 121593]